MGELLLGALDGVMLILLTMEVGLEYSILTNPLKDYNTILNSLTQLRWILSSITNFIPR